MIREESIFGTYFLRVSAALVGLRNSSMGPSGGLNPMTWSRCSIILLSSNCFYYLPVQRALKFSHVLGHTSEKSSNTIRPAEREEEKSLKHAYH